MVLHVPFHTQYTSHKINIQVRQQFRAACNLWFCATHNMGGLASPYTNHPQHTNTMSTANHSVSKYMYRNQAQNLKENNLVEHIKLIMGEWVGTTGFTHLDCREWSETTCTLAYVRRHVSSAWQPVAWQQMAFHMRDHASSFLFSLEEPLSLFMLLLKSWNHLLSKQVQDWLCGFLFFLFFLCRLHTNVEPLKDIDVRS